MKRLIGIALGVLLVAPLPADANHLRTRRPDCVSRVRAAPAQSLDIAEINVRGFISGGRIGGMVLPDVEGVTPRSSQTDADIAAVPYEYESQGVVNRAAFDVSMAGFLGGGTTKLRAPAGAITTSGGAQRLIIDAFTGHYRVVLRSYVCESRRRRTVYRFSYYEMWLNGLRTPTSAGSPLAPWGIATGIRVLPGDLTAR